MENIINNTPENNSNFVKSERPKLFVGNFVELVNPDQEILDGEDNPIIFSDKIKITKIKNLPDEGWVVNIEGFDDLEFPASIFKRSL